MNSELERQRPNLSLEMSSIQQHPTTEQPSYCNEGEQTEHGRGPEKFEARHLTRTFGERPAC
jgi:hypothetical protein